MSETRPRIFNNEGDEIGGDSGGVQPDPAMVAGADWPYTVTVYGAGIVGAAGFRTQAQCVKYGRTHDMADRFVVRDRAEGVVREEVRDGWRRVR